jgi:asparagine synthase (glutamine-hydrolysing)
MQVGVLLTGKRGNWTISWGNALDYQALLLKQMKWFKFYREMSQYCRNIGAQKSRVIKSASRKAFPALLRLSSSAGQTSYPLLINPDFAQKMNVFDKLAEHGFHITDFSTVSGRQSREHHFRELAIWGLTGTITTRLSLRYRLWDRDPTNDLNVVRFCLSLPEEQYVRNGVDRWLIRRAAKNLLPDMVRMNLRTRGIQGADGVFRMKADWNDFRSEANDLLADPAVSPYLNIEQLKASLACIGDTPKPEYAYHSDFRMLMRGIIFRRFLKNVINQQFSRLKAFDSRTGR